MSTALPLAFRITVTGIYEHLRTVRGRKDPVSGAAVTEQISLGWFIHTDLDAGGISFCVGSERPADVAIGDTLILTMRKEGRIDV